ncbi:MAG TPA: hypothetical protein VH231_17045 [Solirubrobacteraceae bacterium]|jgi:hypothetical protein|nr:hypothetical protein [Solirubrobacteraceae bacterium]
MASEGSGERPARIDYEVDDLVRVLRDYGVLTRDDLRERSGARDWPDDSFAAVLRRAVAEGSIKDLGDGLFELGPDAPDPSQARYGPP